jgi:glutaredoxin-related protein
MAKPELYFSKYCKYSTKIIEELNKCGVNDKFIYISSIVWLLQVCLSRLLK